MMAVTEWSASGVRSKVEARRLAVGFASVHRRPYAVLHYADVREFDVEPAHDDDEVGQSGVVEIVVPE